MSRSAERVAAHQPWLRRVAGRLTGSSSHADDLVQDTCLVALESAPDQAELRPWLGGVLRNLARRARRGGMRRAVREQHYYRDEPTHGEPDPLLSFGVDRGRLDAALSMLREPYRSTVVRRFIEGQSSADIARADGIPAGTVRRRQLRALELLRDSLERPVPDRTRRGGLWLLWALPALGLGRVASAVSRGLGALLGQTKVVGFLLAFLSLLLGARLFTGSAPTGSPGASGRSPTMTGALAARVDADRPLVGSLARPDALSRLRAIGGPAMDEAWSIGPGGLQDRGDGRGPRRADRHDIDQGQLLWARLLEDCQIDARGEVRCDASRTDSRARGRPTCRDLHGKLTFIQSLRSTPTMNNLLTARLLTAAFVANATLAANLGCQADLEEAVVADRRGPGSGSRGSEEEPVCVTHPGNYGGVCTECTDPAGTTSIVCTPGDCFDDVGPDGTPCTTCSDESGTAYSDCRPPATDPDCSVWIQAPGVMCEYCDGHGSSCAVAACSEDAAGCLTCIREDGTQATECDDMALRYGDYPDNEWSFARCGSVLAEDGSFTRDCYYPGPDTCLTHRVRGATCVDCQYAEAVGGGVCTYEPEELPDPLFDRPADLPAPGTCVTETSPGGLWSCSTCTADDLVATRSCHYPVPTSCELVRGPSIDQACLSCTFADGSTARTACMVLPY